MTQIFEGKCITNRHRIFACVYDVDFLEEWKEGGIFFKTPCSSPRAWLSVTLVCYIVHRTQWSIFEISIRKLLGKFKVCFVTHMVLRTWECIKKDIAQNCWKLKFVFSKKATKIDEIFTVDLTVCSKCQIDGEDFIKLCGLLRKHEL